MEDGGAAATSSAKAYGVVREVPSGASVSSRTRSTSRRVDLLSLRRGVNPSLRRVYAALQSRSVVAPEFPRPEHNFASGSQ
jgi:hypothetical protein